MLITVPVYIAEISPAHLRGKLVALSVTSLCSGQLIAVLLNGAFSSLSLELGRRYLKACMISSKQQTFEIVFGKYGMKFPINENNYCAFVN